MEIYLSGEVLFCILSLSFFNKRRAPQSSSGSHLP
jgi:hypothetical protein